MSSLASLAGPPVALGFNATLDSTVAIIIPVLFLALGVQRHLYQDLLKAYYNAARDLRQRARPGTRMVPPLLITVVTGAVTTFILVYGEVDAILALSDRHPVGSETPVVAAVGLAIAVAAGPASALLRAYLSAMRLLSPAGLRRPGFRERPADGQDSAGGVSAGGLSSGLPEAEIGLMASEPSTF
ncbi:MAG: hypothetical protein ACRDPO_14570 [Streptosporangiaceae bacterium]